MFLLSQDRTHQLYFIRKLKQQRHSVTAAVLPFFLFPLMSTLTYFPLISFHKSKSGIVFYIIGLHVYACVSMCPVIEPKISFDETSLERTPLESTPKPTFSVFQWSVTTNISERCNICPVYFKIVRFKWHVLEKNAAPVDVISLQNIQWQNGNRANIFRAFRSDYDKKWATWDSQVKDGTETNPNNTFTFF
jgi:hypothetical protein